MANYKKLTQLISDNKGDLVRKLEGCSLPSDAEKIKQFCIEYVGSLTRKNAEYMNQLSLLEQDLLSPVLKVMDTIYASDIELSGKANSMHSKEKRPQSANRKVSSKESFFKEYGPALAGAAGGTLLASICKPSSWGVILFGSVISVIIGKVLYSLYIDNNNVVAESGDNNVSYPEYKLTSIDVNNIVKGLETAGECIDKVLLTYRSHLAILQDEYSHKMESFNLDKKYIGILECYQTILGNLSSMGTSPIVKDTIKQVNLSLAGQGYKAVHYSEDIENLFEINIGICQEPNEFKPAILKKCENRETLILKGEVVIPKTK